ncbi:4Fe-4S dicluster domain-containing protein [Candidatus Haliotispira prima]|uniref:4Fe-4S dicluster domain-containing protein n=1 Tax=Candidatus Haliotispira prima TaxID=3034016 RepID=A0ABY8MEY3_9SPIO|nr:4Fe-4S dicluster domain-containing protein [Candidatus Haliotispira prima]
MAKEPRTFHIWVDDEVCKSCGLCIANCPKKILRFSDRINKQGLNPMECIDHNSCIGCLSCAEICPEVAIQVTGLTREPAREEETHG